MNRKQVFQTIILFFSIFGWQVAAQTNRDAAKAYELDSILRESPDKLVGNFSPDTAGSLPIGLYKEIGETGYIIAVDSSYFLKDGAYFSAYMALKLPGAKQKIAFAAKNIKYNPQGVLGGAQAELQLASPMYIDLGPNITLFLPADGTNNIKWGCNGYESCSLNGKFIFSNNILEPADETEENVTASFSASFSDVNNILAAVGMSPFTMKGMKDYTFEVSEAFVDLSDNLNPPGAELPESQRTTYGNDLNLWRGFYLRALEVGFPEELQKRDEETKVFAREMFIDNSGLTGTFGTENLLGEDEGETDKNWDFSVDEFEMKIVTNKLTSGRMAGSIKIPPLDDNALEYETAITLNEKSKRTDYDFKINPEKSLSFNAFSAKVELAPSTYLEMKRNMRGKFLPKLVATGRIFVEQKNTKFPGLEFERLELLAASPYVAGGVFALTSDLSCEGSGYKLSIADLGIGVSRNQPTFKADVGLNLGKEGSPNNFSVETGILVRAKIEESGEDRKWKYDKTSISDISIELNTSALYLEGLISHKEDDPIYGNGFFGKAAFKINKVMDVPATFACAFGKMPDYKYWMVEAMIPTNIPLGANRIVSLLGGVSYHMEDTRTPEQLVNAISGMELDTSNLDLNPRKNMVYQPNKEIGVGFRAGVALNNPKEEVLNADVVMGVQFNSSGGLRDIALVGKGYSMCDRKDRETSRNRVEGIVSVKYDNVEKILDANISAKGTFKNALTADIYAKMYFSPRLWYVHLGTPSKPCRANLRGLAQANVYFMLGQDLEPMPDPPIQITRSVGNISNQRNEGDIAGGDGIAMGVNLGAGFNGSVYFLDKKWRLYGSGSALLGFDMTLYKYSKNTYCSGMKGEPFGANYWYLNGQVYAYIGIEAGVERMRDNKEWVLLSASIAALLKGSLPNPSYVYGAVNLQGSVLGIVKVDRTFDFDFGKQCTVING